MKLITNLCKRHKGKTMLLLFAHPDDESFVSGGLIQEAKRFNMHIVLLCLTKGEKGLNALKKGKLSEIREKELMNAAKLLKIDTVIHDDFGDTKLKISVENWHTEVKKHLYQIKPAIVVTFDRSGLTGHPDHIALSVESYKLLHKFQKKPVLLWRVPLDIEKKFLKTNNAMKYANSPRYELRLSMAMTIKKLQAIYSHKSQMQGLKFRLQMFLLFFKEPRELYHAVSFKRNYPFEFVPFKITKQT